MNTNAHRTRAHVHTNCDESQLKMWKQSVKCPQQGRRTERWNKQFMNTFWTPEHGKLFHAMNLSLSAMYRWVYCSSGCGCCFVLLCVLGSRYKIQTELCKWPLVNTFAWPFFADWRHTQIAQSYNCNKITLHWKHHFRWSRSTSCSDQGYFSLLFCFWYLF